MWTPGGQNELTDNTEFIIPTKRIVIPERWQANVGPSPQTWADSPLRFLRNWENMGDLMADGLQAGFYGAYSHDEEEGVVRVFDPLVNPGVDVWTYGFHPNNIPMGSGAANKGLCRDVGRYGGHISRRTRLPCSGSVRGLDGVDLSLPAHRRPDLRRQYSGCPKPVHPADG